MMTINHVNSFNAIGFCVRTTNQDETSPSKAKISKLWEKFYTQAAPKLTESSKVFGVYTNYESDHTGAFDVIACADTLSMSMLPGSVDTHIASSKYLVFNAVGQFPQVVYQLWAEIWAYFSSQGCSHDRAFTTDFEFYKNASEVEIYIAIK